MIAKSKKIKARIDEMDRRRRTTSGNNLCIWDSDRGDGCIITNASEDYYYGSVTALKHAIRATMQYGDYNPRDCSWACGGEPALSALATMAGIEDWVAATETRLNRAERREK